MKIKALLSTIALTGIALVVSSEAFAAAATAPQLSSSIANVGKNISQTPILINYASYIIGTALGVAGVSKLKQHVDNPGNVAIKDGLGRVAAAALFISLPYMLNMARGTSGVGTDAAEFISVGTIAQDF